MRDAVRTKLEYERQVSMEEMTSFGYWVRRQRMALDLTQAKLAENVGCALVTIKKIERDERRPSLEMAQLLADNLTIADEVRDRFIKLARGQWIVDVVAAPSAPLDPAAIAASTRPNLIPQPRPAEHIDAPAEVVSGLPIQTTSFIGRASEIHEVKDLLAEPTHRLVTIIGAGGMGKSRLALQIAESLRDHFNDGVAFVPLAGVDDVDLVPGAIVDALNLFTGDRTDDVRQRLYRYLQHRKMLLVLDNFEQLAADAGFLSQLICETHHLQLLVTSRVRLNLLEEWPFPLRRLAHPGYTGATEEEGYPAVDLFIERASQIDPQFDPSTEEDSILTICRLVEGMPLAIELAATWVHVLSCSEIASEIRRDLDFLTSSLGNQAPEHRSLRAVFEGSWNLLTVDEQQSLAQLAVFRGGFDRDAAGEIADATLETLAKLVDRSLIRRQRSGRFDIHEMLRRFAAEKLAVEPAAVEMARDRHGAYFGNLMAAMPWYLEVPDKRVFSTEAEGFRALSNDFHNFIAAWRWATQRLDNVRIRQMVRVLGYYLVRTSQPHEMMQLYDKAIAAFENAESISSSAKRAVVATLLLHKGHALTERLDSAVEAVESLSRSLDLLRSNNQQRGVEHALALVGLGRGRARLGYHAGSAELIEEGCAIFKALNHRRGMGRALVALALIELSRGRLAAREKYLKQARRLLEPGNLDSLLDILHLLGNTYLMQGRFDEAEPLLIRTIEQYDTNGSRMPFIQRNLADLFTATGEFDLAAALFLQAEAGFRRMDITFEVENGLVYSPGMLSLFQGDRQEADKQLVQSLNTARRLNDQLSIVLALTNLSRLRIDESDLGSALELLEEALTTAQRIDFRFGIAYSLSQLGRTNQALGQWDQADGHFKESLQICVAEKIDRFAVDSLLGMACRLLHQGDVEQASELAAMISVHAASDFETRRNAERLLSELTADPDGNAMIALPPASTSAAYHDHLRRILHE